MKGLGFTQLVSFSLVTLTDVSPYVMLQWRLVTQCRAGKTASYRWIITKATSAAQRLIFERSFSHTSSSYTYENICLVFTIFFSK